jgi:hypothetical protein
MVLGGVFVGVDLGSRNVANDVRNKVDAATTTVDQLKSVAINGALSEATDQTAADAAAEKAEEVKSKLGEIGSLLGSLPEHLRFAGLLILVGALLMSVATVQFGGQSIF